MFYSTPDEVAGCLQLPSRAPGCPAAGPWGHLGDRLGALEAAEALAQGHAEALA